MRRSYQTQNYRGGRGGYAHRCPFISNGWRLIHLSGLAVLVVFDALPSFFPIHCNALCVLMKIRLLLSVKFVSCAFIQCPCSVRSVVFFFPNAWCSSPASRAEMSAASSFRSTLISRTVTTTCAMVCSLPRCVFSPLAVCDVLRFAQNTHPHTQQTPYTQVGAVTA